jgi:hypothetical protein
MSSGAWGASVWVMVFSEGWGRGHQPWVYEAGRVGRTGVAWVRGGRAVSDPAMRVCGKRAGPTVGAST